MLDLAKSLLRLSLASSLAGARGCAFLLGAVNDRGRDDTFRLAYQAGESLQGEWVDLLWRARGPEEWPAVLREMEARLGDTLRFVAPTEGGEVARQELLNKMAVFRWVPGADSLLGEESRGEISALHEGLRRAAALGGRRELWVVEGLGYLHVRALIRRWGHQHLPPKLFAGVGVADSSQPMLHAGLGLALAEHLLATFPRHRPKESAKELVEHFSDLCAHASADEHLDVAKEALGLVARCFFPDQVVGLASAVASFVDEREQAMFWHGVGRGLYFVPVNLLPGLGSVEHVLAMVGREAPEGKPLEAAQSGVGYAFTLVNLSRPDILEAWVGRNGGEDLAGAFGDGLRAALTMRRRVSGDDPDLRRFIDHRPQGVKALEAWERWIRFPLAEPASAFAPDLYSSLGRSTSAEITGQDAGGAGG